MKAVCNLMILLIIGTVISGCASTSNASRSGFLDDYSQLTPLSNYPNTFAYQAKDFDNKYLRALTKVYIQPFEVWLDENNLKGINLQQMAEFIGYFHAQLTQQLAEHYQVVTTPDNDTLVIQGAFTKAKTQAPDLSAADMLPFRIVMNAGNVAYLTATGQKDVVSEVGIEVKFTEGTTNKLLFAMAANKTLDLTVQDNASGNADAVKKVLLEWATNFAKHIHQVKS